MGNTFCWCQSRREFIEYTSTSILNVYTLSFQGASTCPMAPIHWLKWCPSQICSISQAHDRCLHLKPGWQLPPLKWGQHLTPIQLSDSGMSPGMSLSQKGNLDLHFTAGYTDPVTQCSSPAQTTALGFILGLLHQVQLHLTSASTLPLCTLSK